ncbi:DnaD domain-containing protein [Periweissella beninensis]|uniref:DnaD domain protein n=1 Tax=Periweissella beninensis TaxID=504936 RepID=A0ABT0VJL7_9LACO|nr:DnaD domain protein [Periweissella beninensis]MBM7544178.1 DNA replication protein [Periweissella beninensis]MCM2437614.1 DnaD domain protein [Periweissella beninensis]MCT4396649.1 DnaD domain protein [Periweissella beninensis]
MKINENNLNNYIQSGNTVFSNYLLIHYFDIGMSNEQLLIYIQAKSALDQGTKFPDLDMIANNLHFTKNQVANELQKMVNAKLAEIETMQINQQHKMDVLSFNGLTEKLLTMQIKNDNDQAIPKPINTATSRSEIFANIESEFRRPLSSIELQKISEWLDSYSFKPEMILLALKEAVLNNVYNLRYIEQILINWQQKNINTAHEVEVNRQARQQSINREGNSKQNVSNQKYIDIPFDNIFD